jgi:hypothetical protein
MASDVEVPAGRAWEVSPALSEHDFRTEISEIDFLDS